MPTYVYKCKTCGNTFEKFQSILASSETECPQCNNSAGRQITTGGGLILKGSGFYQNDYKKDTCCSSGEKCDSPKRCCGK